MPLVKFNVGGQLFYTTTETLENFPSMLGSLVSKNNPAALIDGHLFIDRDPHIFRWILNYLRGYKILPNKGSTDMYQLLEEAEYFAVDGLTARIRHMTAPMFNKGDHISVRDTKFTIIDVQDTGYIATRGGKQYRLDSSEQFQPTRIEKGDIVTAYHAPHKWEPGVCLGVRRNDCSVQFNNEKISVKLSGVRF
jgi:hypothetical protein